MRKQTSLRTTQSASARERFLVFCAGVVSATARLNRLSAPSNVMAFDEASPGPESKRRENERLRARSSGMSFGGIIDGLSGRFLRRLAHQLHALRLSDYPDPTGFHRRTDGFGAGRRSTRQLAGLHTLGSI